MVLSSAALAHRAGALIIVTAYTKLRAIVCTKAGQNIRWEQLWDLEGCSKANGTDARACPDALLIISDAIWELIS